MLHCEHAFVPRGPTELTQRFWSDRDGRCRSLDREILIEMFPEQSPMLLGGSRDHLAGKEVKGSTHDGTSVACSHAHT